MNKPDTELFHSEVYFLKAMLSINHRRMNQFYIYVIFSAFLKSQILIVPSSEMRMLVGFKQNFRA